MEFASFRVAAPSIVLATAVHSGHELRPELAVKVKIEEETRLREEDPHTDELAARVGSWVVVHRSRFEVDLNREREKAVYREPEDAWGIEIWESPLADAETEESLRLYDRFYTDLGAVLDSAVAAHGGFVLYDIHSYNHRRGGPGADPEPAVDNPSVNLGTGSLPDRWIPVADAFMESMSTARVEGVLLDVRQNVRFEGRQIAKWVHDRYGSDGCALAIEFKKTFMDEWSGDVDGAVLEQLGEAVAASVEPVTVAWRSA